MATKNDATTTGEEDDLTTCCVCMEVYNDLERRPKCLSCHHTYCLTCIKVYNNQISFDLSICNWFIIIQTDFFHFQKMACRPPHQVTCPKCKVICVLPEKGPEALFTNDLVLSYIQLKNRVNNQQYESHFKPVNFHFIIFHLCLKLSVAGASSVNPFLK